MSFTFLGERDLLSFQVKCTHSDHGCSWVGELREIEEHLNKCSADIILCPYAAVGCPAKILRHHLEEHKTTCAVDHLGMAMDRINLLEKCIKTKAEDKCLPPVVFKMENFTLYQQSCSEWESGPFYTHDRGYKLYLRVSPSSFSVHICLMHGEYDDDLIWPFRGTIDFELLNQIDDNDHKKGVAMFLQHYNSKKNKRVPVEEGKRSVGWGCDDILMDASDQYIREDSLYIRVSCASVSECNKPWLIHIPDRAIK